MSQMKHYSPDNHQRIGESHHGELGFTLMETTIALLILMVVGLGADSLFFYAATNTSTARDRQLALAVGRKPNIKAQAETFSDELAITCYGSYATLPGWHFR